MASSQNEIDFLRETLSQASLELKKRFGTNLKISTKDDSSIVTEADLASEKVIIERISRYFPDDKILSEEAGLSSNDRKEGSFIWVIDPLDGTTNYANGYEFYCISIGRGRFRSDGTIEMVLGGIEDPSRDKCYYGGLKRGAFVNGARLKIAPDRDFTKCFLVTGFYYKSGDELLPDLERFSRIQRSCQAIRRDGAAALDLALVAAGVFDGFWELGLQPWDVAAGSLLVNEAGGVTQNYEPRRSELFDIEAPGIITGNAETVQEMHSRCFDTP